MICSDIHSAHSSKLDIYYNFC